MCVYIPLMICSGSTCVYMFTFNDLWQFYVCVYIPLMIRGNSTCVYIPLKICGGYTVIE